MFGSRFVCCFHYITIFLSPRSSVAVFPLCGKILHAIGLAASCFGVLTTVVPHDCRVTTLLPATPIVENAAEPSLLLPSCIEHSRKVSYNCLHTAPGELGLCVWDCCWESLAFFGHAKTVWLAGFLPLPAGVAPVVGRAFPATCRLCKHSPVCY